MDGSTYMTCTTTPMPETASLSTAVQHGLGDGLKQVLWLLHIIRCISQINDPNLQI